MTRAIESVYVAASSTDTARAQEWVDRLGLAGINVVSTWLNTIASVGEANPREATKQQRAGWSAADLGELRACDLLWFLVPPADKPTRGAWLEVGFAEAAGKLLVCSGDTKQSIFCALGDEYAHDVDAFAHICRLVRVGSHKREVVSAALSYAVGSVGSSKPVTVDLHHSQGVDIAEVLAAAAKDRGQ